MPTIRALKSYLPILLVCLAAVACASTAEDAGTTADALYIEVQPGFLLGSGTIHLISPDGVRRFVGTVSGAEAEVFRIPGPVVAGQYRLVVEGTGRTIASRLFTMREPGVRWNLDANTVFPLSG